MTLSKQTFIIMITISLGILSFGTYTLNSLRSTLIENKKEEIETILAIAVKQASVYIQQEKAGLISHNEAKQSVINQLSNMRNGDSYVWANDNTGMARVHPDSSVLGTFQKSYARYIEHLEVSPYYFTLGESRKPSEGDRLFLKVNGMTKLPGWDWMLGIGFYLHDINSIFNGIIGKSVLIGIVLLLAVLLFVWLIMKWFRERTLGGDPKEAARILENMYMGNLSNIIKKPRPNTLLSNLSKIQIHFKRVFTKIETTRFNLTKSIKNTNMYLEEIERISSKHNSKSPELKEAILKAQDEIKKSMILTSKIEDETKDIK